MNKQNTKGKINTYLSSFVFVPVNTSVVVITGWV